LITRRGLLRAGSAAAGSLLLSGCDEIANSRSTRWALDFGEWLSLRAHRLLLAGQPLVREYAVEQLSPDFPPNGTEMPNGFAYFEMMISQFERFRLKVDGLVRNPLELSLDELNAIAACNQVTQHNCVD